MHSPNQVFGAACNTSSHGLESTSPWPATQQDKQPVNLNDSSSSSEEVEEVTGRTRVNWTELENQRLLSAWCHHSIDAVKGTDQKAEHYWKAVAVEFNSNTPKKESQKDSPAMQDTLGWFEEGYFKVLWSLC